VSGGSQDREEADRLLAALARYRTARQEFLAAMGLPGSNRDPLAELAEMLVAALMGGTLATSRVQADYDVVLAGGATVQVRYLANSGATWVNEHRVYRIRRNVLYALVIFEAFVVVGVLVFPSDELGSICAALGKRHPHQDSQLLLTRINWWAIRDAPDRFRALGMRVWLSPLT